MRAQEAEAFEYTIEKQNSLAIGGHASTNGLGANIIYSFNDKLAIRTGFEQLKFNFDFNFDENDISYDANFNYKTGSISLLVDYYLFRSVYLTGGVGFSSFNPYIKGEASSSWKYGDIYIPPEDIGKFSFSVEPSMKISPYAGIGFGRNIGLNKRIAVNFEMGAFYLGSPDITINATGLLAPTSDPAHGQKNLFEKQLESYRFYPVLKFGISVKLF
jgi:hypothetical protein